MEAKYYIGVGCWLAVLVISIDAWSVGFDEKADKKIQAVLKQLSPEDGRLALKKTCEACFLPDRTQLASLCMRAKQDVQIKLLRSKCRKNASAARARLGASVAAPPTTNNSTSSSINKGETRSRY